MFKREIIILAIIVLIGGFLRIYRLDTLPPSLEWDEVATGYDANSILKTGKDQYGHFLPLTFRSLDDYKPPLYTYLTVGSIALLGWTDFAVRFPAALLGTLAIITTYGMTYELFKNKKVALLSALLLCISPWHVNFSRLALETNSTIFFTTAGVWAFFVGLRRGPFIILSAVLFGLNLYLYHNARIFIPLLGMLLIGLYFQQLWQHKKYVILAALVTGIFVARLIPIALSVEGQMRFEGTSIFTPAVPLDITAKKAEYQDWKTIDNEEGMGLVGRILHSDKVMYGLMLTKNYLTHFDPTFWVFTNDSPRHHASEVGLIYLVELPLILAGFYYLLGHDNKKAVVIIIAWMLFTPIPAAVTRDVPHALRTAIFLPSFQILAALSLVGLKQTFSKKVHQGLWVLVAVGYFVNCAFFLHQYYVHFNTDTSQAWQYGRRDAAAFTESVKSNYGRVIVSTKLEQPHAFFLYYTHYDPVKYLAEGGTVSGGWAEDRNHFDKYYFKPIDFKTMSNGHTLFVGLPDEFPPDAKIIKKIYYLDGKDAVWIGEG